MIQSIRSSSFCWSIAARSSTPPSRNVARGDTNHSPFLLDRCDPEDRIGVEDVEVRQSTDEDIGAKELLDEVLDIACALALVFDHLTRSITDFQLETITGDRDPDVLAELAYH